MKDGYWINYQTGKMFPVDEHETWIRYMPNAKKLGLSLKNIFEMERFVPIRDREKLLLHLMKTAPIMRVRAHGHYATFEYWAKEKSAPMDSIYMWGKKVAGPMTGMYIVNFGTREKVEMPFEEFENIMDNKGPEGIMRVESVKKFRMKREYMITE